MNRFSHLDTDEERLPHGMVRTGYDADTQTYHYKDTTTGDLYVGAPGAYYGHLRRVSTATPSSSARNNTSSARNNTSSSATCNTPSTTTTQNQRRVSATPSSSSYNNTSSSSPYTSFSSSLYTSLSSTTHNNNTRDHFADRNPYRNPPPDYYRSSLDITAPFILPGATPALPAGQEHNIRRLLRSRGAPPHRSPPRKNTTFEDLLGPPVPDPIDEGHHRHHSPFRQLSDASKGLVRRATTMRRGRPARFRHSSDDKMTGSEDDKMNKRGEEGIEMKTGLEMGYPPPGGYRPLAGGENHARVEEQKYLDAIEERKYLDAMEEKKYLDDMGEEYLHAVEEKAYLKATKERAAEERKSLLPKALPPRPETTTTPRRANTVAGVVRGVKEGVKHALEDVGMERRASRASRKRGT